jgi:LysM repeat protein
MYLIPTVRLLTLISLTLSLVSCQNGKSLFNKSVSTQSDPYVANYANDGGYNPYPGQPGQVAGGSAPTYTAPPAPIEADPYAFNAPTSTRPKTTPSPASSSTPKKSMASTKPKSKSTAKKSSGSYKVVSGDSLYAIARKRGTTVAKIKAANSLKSDLIRPGQALKIP